MLAAGWKPNKPSRKIQPQEFAQTSQQLSWVTESHKHQVRAACRPSSCAGRRKSYCLPPLPFPQQMQECFDVRSPGPECPAPGLNTSQTLPLPPDKSPKLRQAPFRGVPAFPSCRIKVKNSSSPCTCSSEAKTVFYFYSPDFLVVVYSPGHRAQGQIEKLSFSTVQRR